MSTYEGIELCLGSDFLDSHDDGGRRSVFWISADRPYHFYTLQVHAWPKSPEHLSAILITYKAALPKSYLLVTVTWVFLIHLEDPRGAPMTQVNPMN
jgi:hypothetical protein